jgi:hypothetical protein
MFHWLNHGKFAAISDIAIGYVTKNCSKASTKSWQAGRPSCVTDEKVSELLRLVHVSAHDRNFVTKSDVLQFTEENFGNVLNYGWVNSFLNKPGEALQPRSVLPQENICFHIPSVSFDGYISLIQKSVPKVPTEWNLIFARHDYLTGRSNAEAWRYSGGKIRNAGTLSSWQENRTWIISMHDVGCLWRLLSISHGNKSIGASIFLYWVFDNWYTWTPRFGHQHMSTRSCSFNIWMKIWILVLEGNQQPPQCGGKPAVLFCQECSAYCNARILKLLADNMIIVISYAVTDRISFKFWAICHFADWNKRKHICCRMSFSVPSRSCQTIFSSVRAGNDRLQHQRVIWGSRVVSSSVKVLPGW